MKNKSLLLTLSLISSIIIFASCTAEKTTPNVATTATQTANQKPQPQQIILTLDELKTYNGKDGQKAYVAVDDVVYDVTELPKWKNGEHNGYKAGEDLTQAISKAPHGKAILERATVVGKIKS